MKRRFAVVNGPNLNWLGRREPKYYGTQSWDEIARSLLGWAERGEGDLDFFQSNSEGALIDYLQSLAQRPNHERVVGIVFNPGAYAHTSIALRDCVAMLSIPVVEVHLSAIQNREKFRHHSYIADVAQARIVGFGWQGYLLGLELLKHVCTEQR